MEVILLEKIRNLGQLGDKVAVRPGYGRNYLLPQNKAVLATLENINKFDELRVELEAKSAALLTDAQERAKQLGAITVTITANASDEGKLYGSITPRDVCEAIKAAGHEVAKREIVMPEGSIHELGEYEIKVYLHTDVVTKVKIVVEAAKL